MAFERPPRRAKSAPASATARPSLCEEARVAFERPAGEARRKKTNKRDRAPELTRGKPAQAV